MRWQKVKVLTSLGKMHQRVGDKLLGIPPGLLLRDFRDLVDFHGGGGGY